MSQAVGTVTAFESEKKTSKQGKPFTVHLVVLDNGDKFEAGYKRPDSVRIGDIAVIDWEVKYGAKAIVSIRRGAPSDVAQAAQAPAQAPQQSAAPARGSFGKTFPVPADHPDRSIIRQNSLNHATQAVASLVAAKALKVADEEEFATLTIKVARLYEAYSSGAEDSLADDVDAALAEFNK